MEMTIHQALSYLKTADKRIEDKIVGDTYVTFVKIGADKINGESANTARAEMKSSYQSVCDILKRVEDIKKAINKANAEIIITVCGEEMSVASALYMMNYGLDVKKKLLSSMRQQYITAKQNVEYKNGSELENKVNKFVETMYGGKEKANSSEAIGAIEDYRKKNSYELVDPIGISEEIKKLTDWIDDFEAEVDAKIQMSNSTHTITIPD